MAQTTLGEVAYVDVGEGAPVLFVHGSPGGSDQGALMGAFLVSAGFRVVAPSRPGYLGTPLTDATATPDQQAELELALMDTLGIDRFGVMCWSGGGPSSYRLAVRHPERVTALVSLAAVSKAYTFEHPHEEGLLTGGFGKWLMKELVRHSPKAVVKMTATEEGDLSKEQAKELTEHIWNDPAKRDFVLGLMGTVSGGRRAGYRNDLAQFPAIEDLELEKIRTPTLLVHATTDSDVTPDNSEHAVSRIPGAQIVRVETGTHVSVWTDPTSQDLQARITEFLRWA
jgi:pimeloyl-ACP methyl ester carboxylesterase